MEKRSFYRLLRMKWLEEPAKTRVESWEVEDYRALSLDALFERLEQIGIVLDRTSFLALVDELDAPEQLTEQLLTEIDRVDGVQDQIYLLLFELWRRLAPEKLSLFLFCDELDHQIDTFINQENAHTEALQDTLANLAVLLDDNTDEGEDPQEVFASVSDNCAHDVEGFLYDYIADQIDNNDSSYAGELLDNFSPYITEIKWFDLLKARLVALTDISKSEKLMQNIVRKAMEENDLEFDLAILSTLSQGGDREQFVALVAHALTMLQTEEEFQELLAMSAEYFHYLDHDHEEVTIQNILQQRAHIPMERLLDQKDPHFDILTRTVLS